MSKNLIYTTAINHDTSTFSNSDYSQYCLNTWQAWCDKNGVDFFVIAKHDSRYKYPVWNKDLIFEYVGEKYDKIMYVDSDTMIKWDAPNPFDTYNDEFCTATDRASLKWILNSIDAYQPFFNETKLNLETYFNSGVCMFTKEHKPIFNKLIEFYERNSASLDSIKGVGKVQTVLNFMLEKEGVKRKTIPPTWNLFSIHKKNMFKHNWQLNEDMTPFFVKYAFVWHFTGFPIEDRTKIMKQVWEQYKEYYA